MVQKVKVVLKHTVLSETEGLEALKVTLQLEFVNQLFWQIAASSVLENLVHLIGYHFGTRGSCV